MKPPSSPTPSLREQLRKNASCKHFNGTQHGTCEAGVVYESVRKHHEPLVTLFDGATTRVSLPCLMNANPGGAVCDRCVPPTEEDLEAEAAEVERLFTAIDAGRSPCCNAPLDESRLVTDAQGKRSGPRHCSKCGKWVDRFCNAEPLAGFDDELEGDDLN